MPAAASVPDVDHRIEAFAVVLEAGSGERGSIEERSGVVGKAVAFERHSESVFLEVPARILVVIYNHRIPARRYVLENTRCTVFVDRRPYMAELISAWPCRRIVEQIARHPPAVAPQSNHRDLKRRTGIGRPRRRLGWGSRWRSRLRVECRGKSEARGEDQYCEGNWRSTRRSGSHRAIPLLRHKKEGPDGPSCKLVRMAAAPPPGALSTGCRPSRRRSGTCSSPRRPC